MAPKARSKEIVLDTLEALLDKTMQTLEMPAKNLSQAQGLMNDILAEAPAIIEVLPVAKIGFSVYSGIQNVKMRHNFRKIQAVLATLAKNDWNQETLAIIPEHDRKKLLEVFILTLDEARAEAIAIALTYLWGSLLKGKISKQEFIIIAFSLQQINPIVFEPDYPRLERSAIQRGQLELVSGPFYMLPTELYSTLTTWDEPSIVFTDLGRKFYELVYEPTIGHLNSEAT